jgi:hypothetical protein
MRATSSHLLRLGPLAVLLTLACSSGTPAGPALHLPVAEASASCGPTDGPAVELLLSAAAGEPPVPPLVRVVVFQSRTALAGRRWLLTPEAGAASLQRTPDATPEMATSGRLTITRVAGDGTLSGQVWLRFADGTRVLQSFTAPWRERSVLCG